MRAKYQEETRYENASPLLFSFEKLAISKIKDNLRFEFWASRKVKSSYIYL
jgi:hypothetical protein